jgi:sialic acid synthase SpsE/quercetin dioxygenase-like cupin family protein
MQSHLPSPLFILEMANNHMGDVEHGLRIIRECAQATAGMPYAFAIKLQYRHLDTFIHPDFQERRDLKYVKRFQETRLTESEFLQLRRAIADHGFLAACTPFDEPSVDLFEKHAYDILKIGSCSFTDWPLLERCVKAAAPIVASTAGAPLEDIDKVVNFFAHRDRPLALMHCVAEYPTAVNQLRLGQLDVLRKRYPDVAVGFSTHEPPDSLQPIKLAVGKGATLFEKHVGVPTSRYALNDYSATPEQVRRWVEAAAEAWEMCGASVYRDVGSEREVASLRALRRGAYARVAVETGRRIPESQVFFAMPVQDGQLAANDFSKYAEVNAVRAIPANGALTGENAQLINHREQVYEIARLVKDLLNKSGVVAPRRADLEISHHYGFDRFRETGLTMITVVNREYCKKLLVMLPGQRHPEQYHKIKEETFHVLYGDLLVTLDGTDQPCRAGDVITVERNVRHAFSTTEGAVVEEVSSSHITADSYYTDAAIGLNQNRKTSLTYWLEGPPF